ncbi:hypothetical protein [Nocardia aurantiaca]|uniref:Uncharacterized protein n=1 Tax=Nocardia aurantiaca TaxID=2675850 RepID=A0A6I3KWG2_9NOCA|nr:hypothetical protein [Nocardia aurantiaca]MTE13957.1 hypothetical protein [Nocardia aurantiaca]
MPDDGVSARGVKVLVCEDDEQLGERVRRGRGRGDTSCAPEGPGGATGPV